LTKHGHDRAKLVTETPTARCEARVHPRRATRRAWPHHHEQEHPYCGGDHHHGGRPRARRAACCVHHPWPLGARATPPATRHQGHTQAPCTPALAHASSLDTDRARNARAPTSNRSNVFCAIWVFISSSSSVEAQEHSLESSGVKVPDTANWVGSGDEW
jgi:hypothetical protein